MWTVHQGTGGLRLYRKEMEALGVQDYSPNLSFMTPQQSQSDIHWWRLTLILPRASRKLTLAGAVIRVPTFLSKFLSSPFTSFILGHQLNYTWNLLNPENLGTCMSDCS